MANLCMDDVRRNWMILTATLVPVVPWKIDFQFASLDWVINLNFNWILTYLVVLNFLPTNRFKVHHTFSHSFTKLLQNLFNYNISPSHSRDHISINCELQTVFTNMAKIKSLSITISINQFGERKTVPVIKLIGRIAKSDSRRALFKIVIIINLNCSIKTCNTRHSAADREREINFYTEHCCDFRWHKVC